MCFLPGTHTADDAKTFRSSRNSRGGKYGFESPFKAEVYFVRRASSPTANGERRIRSCWRDTEFGMVRLRAFGTFAVRAKYPPGVAARAGGNQRAFHGPMRSRISFAICESRFADAVGTSKIPALDLAGNYSQLPIMSPRGFSRSSRRWAGIGEAGSENICCRLKWKPRWTSGSMGVIGNMNAVHAVSGGQCPGRRGRRNPGGLGGAGAASGRDTSWRKDGSGDESAGRKQRRGGSPAVAEGSAFFAVLDGKQAGPVCHGQLQEQVGAGKMTRDTLVWAGGNDAVVGGRGKCRRWRRCLRACRRDSAKHSGWIRSGPFSWLLRPSALRLRLEEERDGLRVISSTDGTRRSKSPSPCPLPEHRERGQRRDIRISVMQIARGARLIRSTAHGLETRGTKAAHGDNGEW